MSEAEYSSLKQNEILRSQLEAERSSFISHWRELSDHILPRRQRFSISDVNRGDRRNQKIIDSTATLAARTLRSGMMAGITSPARPWFRLTTPDPALSEVPSVKDWLYTVGQRMATTFLKSNLYNVLPIVYGDIGTFATAAMAVEEDFDSVVRFYPFPIGSYRIANNDRLKVDVFNRDFRMTVRQLVQRFGLKSPEGDLDMKNAKFWDNFSVTVRNLYDRKEFETWVDVAHVIRPNEQFDPKRMDSKFKRYSSCYYEIGRGIDNKDRYLQEKGYDYFPILCPRWEVTGEDVYGTDCPGMTVLGDVKQLMLGEKRIAQAIEKMINPPMTGPTSLMNAKSSILPGDITYVDIREGQQGFRPAHEVNPRTVELEGKQQQIRQRISRGYFEDLFLMLANSDRREITAREIEERHEEKLLALGPVLEQLNQDLLDPLIDITFMMMNRQGLIPEPPQELQGVELKVEYISVMAQAQKLVGISSIERFASFSAQVVAAHPEAADKIDTDQMLDVYSDMTSVPPGIVRSDEDVAAIRQQKAAAQQAQNSTALIQQAAGAAKDLSQADMGGDNALTRLLKDSQAGALTGS